MKKGYTKEAPQKTATVKKGYEPSKQPTTSPGRPAKAADESEVKKGYDTSKTEPVEPSTEANQATKNNLAEPNEQTDKSAPDHVKREVSRSEFIARMAAGRLKSKAKTAAASATTAATAK